MNVTAIYPGTFDPLTNGHTDLIQRAASIANVLWQLAQKYAAENELPWGIYHFSNTPATTWHGFALEIFKQAVEAGLLERAPVLNPIKTSDYPTPAKRPAWSVMDCSTLVNMLGIGKIQFTGVVTHNFKISQGQLEQFTTNLPGCTRN